MGIKTSSILGSCVFLVTSLKLTAFPAHLSLAERIPFPLPTWVNPPALPPQHKLDEKEAAFPHAEAQETAARMVLSLCGAIC